MEGPVDPAVRGAERAVGRRGGVRAPTEQGGAGVSVSAACQASPTLVKTCCAASSASAAAFVPSPASTWARARCTRPTRPRQSSPASRISSQRARWLEALSGSVTERIRASSARAASSMGTWGPRVPVSTARSRHRTAPSTSPRSSRASASQSALTAASWTSPEASSAAMAAAQSASAASQSPSSSTSSLRLSAVRGRDWTTLRAPAVSPVSRSASPSWSTTVSCECPSATKRGTPRALRHQERAVCASSR